MKARMPIWEFLRAISVRRWGILGNLVRLGRMGRNENDGAPVVVHVQLPVVDPRGEANNVCPVITATSDIAGHAE